MKAVRIHEFGGPEVLKFEDAPDPELRKDHVLVRIRACALNHLDLWVRKGLPGVTLPHILGSDIAGEVVECGEYISDLHPCTRLQIADVHGCCWHPCCSAGTASSATRDARISVRSSPCSAITPKEETA